MNEPDLPQPEPDLPQPADLPYNPNEEVVIPKPFDGEWVGWADQNASGTILSGMSKTEIYLGNIHSSGQAIDASAPRRTISEALSHAMSNLEAGWFDDIEDHVMTLGEAVDLLTELSRDELVEVFKTEDPVQIAGLITELAQAISNYSADYGYDDFYVS